MRTATCTSRPGRRDAAGARRRRSATLAELGDTAAHRRALYELNKECSAGIPDRGEFTIGYVDAEWD